MKRFRIALVGCGGMANTWVKYALTRPDAEIVALVDVKPENAQAMAQRHGLDAPVFTDVAEAIRASGANLVFDTTIPEAHYQVASTALRLGCDVLSEKPLAATLAQARELVALAQAQGRTYAIMQNRRYLRRIRALRDLIAAGTIGQPGIVNADFYIGAHFGGFRDLMESPLILDMAIHTFDQARFLTGANPVAVYCHEFNPAWSWYRGNAAAVCIFEMSDGSVFCYRGAWCAEGAQTSWEATWRIVGSRGTAIWDGNTLYADVVPPDAEPKFIRETVRVEPPITWAGQEGHFGCLDEMFAALLEGRPPETVCTDNLWSMAMVFGAIESARQGRKVQMAELLEGQP